MPDIPATDDNIDVPRRGLHRDITPCFGARLVQGSGGRWGYKAMDESVHPYYFSCPKRYLTMAPEVCPEWREKVLAHHQRRYPQRGVIKDGNN